MDRWATPLGRFVRSFGVTKLCRAMRAHGESVGQEAVYHWIAGRAQPTPPKAKLLVLLSGQTLTLDEVYSQPRPSDPVTS
jgi:hypothetical protein